MFNHIVLPPAFLIPSHVDSTTTETGAGADSEGAPLLGGGDEDAEIERHLDQTATLPSELGRSGFDVVPPPQRGSQ